MPEDNARREWVTRVLGVTLPTDAGRSVQAIEIWQAAKDTVDSQLQALADNLRKTGIPVLAEASGDVQTLLEPLRVGLPAALREYEAAPDRTGTRAAAQSAIADALTWLQSNERVQAVDTNPFGVTVSAGATLGAALRRLQNELTTEAGVRS
jgi:short-subunit dehydrogenase